MPIDFGSTGVTGVHVSCIAAQRDYFGLEKRLVKAYQPLSIAGNPERGPEAGDGRQRGGRFGPKTLFGYAIATGSRGATPAQRLGAFWAVHGRHRFRRQNE
ncbi:MAG TPA: hypothetical protein VEW69_11975 [Alphaproteobacteria bacterium]|nr:hypothetical protein [Alphaproteobacteria bacterium]